MVVGYLKEDKKVEDRKLRIENGTQFIFVCLISIVYFRFDCFI